MTSLGSLSSGTTNQCQWSGAISPRPSYGVTSYRPRDKLKYLQISWRILTRVCSNLSKVRLAFLNLLDLLHTVFGIATISFQNYFVVAISSMICGETSDPQHRDLPYIIQRLREFIPIFDSLVSILTVTKSELTWQINDSMSLSQVKSLIPHLCTITWCLVLTCFRSCKRIIKKKDMIEIFSKITAHHVWYMYFLEN